MNLNRFRLLASLIACAVVEVGQPPHVDAAIMRGFFLAASDGVSVEDAWARASAGAATTGAAYFTLRGGSQTDALVGASTPIAASADVHQSFIDQGLMKMRPVAPLPIPTGKIITFAPGGYHVMLMGLIKPLAVGQTFPLTLRFEHGEPITIDVTIRPIADGPPPTGQMHVQ